MKPYNNEHAMIMQLRAAGDVGMRVFVSWTGGKADALRQAFHMTIEDFARKLGLSPRTITYWRQRPDMIQRPERQRILDTTLDQAPGAVKARFSMLLDQDRGIPTALLSDGFDLPNPANADPSPLFESSMTIDGASLADARRVIEWVESTNTSDDIIGYFTQTIARAAEEHASHPPNILLTKVEQLHAMIHTLLRTGKQRYHQVGDLLHLDSDLLAHLCQILGDVQRDQDASAYAEASIVLGKEAGSESAAAFSAQSQMARWRGDYVKAADLAAKGLVSNPQPALRTLLAYQEADAAAASGQMNRRALLALQRADAMDDAATVYSVWSCPPARRALFRMGVALNLGDPREALRQAAEAEPIWEHEKPLAFGTWAHFQIGAAKAHIMLDSVDGAIQQVAPVLELPREYRISTLAGHVGTLDALLLNRRFSKSRQVASLREQLARFAVSTADAPQKEQE